MKGVSCTRSRVKSGVWKDIPTPDASVSQTSGVYVGGRCYWSAYLGFSLGGSSTDYGSDIVSFDFTTESFHCLHSPPLSSNTVFDLVEYRGSLGAIGFSRPGDATRGFGFEFWVREECSWTKVFDVVLSNVERVPLGLIDGRFLFLERKCRSNELLYQLVVYDRITKEWKELDIYDYERQMEVSPYVEGRVALPDAMPMQRYEDDDDDSGDSCTSTDEDEGEENEDGDSCMSTDEDEDEEDEENEDEDEEEKQINERRRERCDDWYDDDVDDSCEDEEDDDDTEHSGMSTDDDDDDDDEEENDDDDDDDYDEDEDKEADDR